MARRPSVTEALATWRRARRLERATRARVLATERADDPTRYVRAVRREREARLAEASAHERFRTVREAVEARYRGSSSAG
jgi:hypothetical protein